MTKRTCSVDGCDRRHRANGLCSMHEQRLARTGTTDPGPKGGTPEERFWMRVDKNGANGCWIWTGARHRSGYGKSHRVLLAHRYSWSLHSGQAIPPGMTVDHMCHTRACVNPDHLQVVTMGENHQNHPGTAQRNSKTGVRGVTRQDGRWSAQVQLNGVKHRESYDSLEEAAEAVVKLRNRLFTNNLRDRR